ncbi:MAG: flagellar hook-basal body protein [Conexibacter sp.]|nr:flagellar hook-basal body protein [Conexibacter sp.]
MMRSMYSAISGLSVNQTMLDTTANNLANVNTIGYKGQRTTFQDALSETQRGAAGANQANGGSNALQIGLGVQLGSIDNQMAQGASQTTGNPLDVYIQGTGWLRVGDGAPDVTDATANQPRSLSYTRSGDLTTNASGLVQTQAGHYVVGVDAVATRNANGSTSYAAGTTPSYIIVPPGSTDVAIGQDGSVSYQDASTGQRVTAGYIALAKFANEPGLQRAGGSLWSASPTSGGEIVGTPGTTGLGSTIAGSLEMSNVDLATEFTTMITAQRGFQANSRVITTADEMLQTLVSMKQ